MSQLFSAISSFVSLLEERAPGLEENIGLPLLGPMPTAWDTDRCPHLTSVCVVMLEEGL